VAHALLRAASTFVSTPGGTGETPGRIHEAPYKEKP